MEDRQSVHELNQKKQESLQEIPLKTLAENVIKDYEKLLYDGLVINGSFTDILDKKSRPFKRIAHWIFMVLYIGIIIPRLSWICLLYLEDEDTRRFWQYYLTDYFEQMGMFGRCLNIIYLVFDVAVVMDKLVLHFFEHKGCVHFLTNFLTLVPEDKYENGKDDDDDDSEVIESVAGPSHREDTVVEVDVLSEQDKRQLLIRAKNYIKISRILSKTTCHFCHFYSYLSCSLFIYHMNPSIPVVVMAVLNMIVLLYAEHTTITYCITVYTSFVVTVEYFKVRIRFLMSKAKGMKIRFEEQVVSQVISLYMRLMLDFKKQDVLLKHLLRDLIYVYMVELSLLFFLLTLNVNPLLRVILAIPPLSMALGIMTAGLYIGQLHSKTLDLYLELNHSMANNTISNQVSLKSRKQALLAIKELGSNQVDGQFVMGLRDGSGPATSSHEIFNLTLETVTYTLMFIQMTMTGGF